MVLNLLEPGGYANSPCGYCKGKGKGSPTSSSYGLVSTEMAPKFYLLLMNRGWRRSGDYYYHPDMLRTCCPQYTIRLEVAAFKPSRQQRGTINKWNRFLLGDKGEKTGKGKQKEFDLWAELNKYTEEECQHKFEEMELTPAVATDETFELYKRYQVAVHKDSPSAVWRPGFERFLCNSPLSDEGIIQYSSDTVPSGLPKTYGSYHLLYRVDSQLVGISVIDILPTCVSSVYFIWDPDWAWASLGKLSALYEIALVNDLAQAGADMRWLYMGYWIANCQKMRYKGDYSPSFLLDPGTNVFHPLTTALDQFLQCDKGYTPFLEIEALDETTVEKQYDSWNAIRDDCMAGVLRNNNDNDGDDYGNDNGNDKYSPGPLLPLRPGFLGCRAVAQHRIDPVTVLADVGPGGERILMRFTDYKSRLNRLGLALAKDLVQVVGLELMSVNGDYDKGILMFD